EAQGSWEREVRRTEGYARDAVIALLVTAGLRAFQLVVSAWRIAVYAGLRAGEFPQHSLGASERLAAASAVGVLVMLVITGGFFLRWLSRAVRVAGTLSPTSIRW